MSDKPIRKNYSELGLPVGPYVHSVSYNGVLYLSGLTAFGTPHQAGSIVEQTKAIFDQILFIAQQESSGLEYILSVVLYVVSLEEIGELRDSLFEMYGDAIPTSTLVEVSRLFSPDLRIEVTATIALP